VPDAARSCQIVPDPARPQVLVLSIWTLKSMLQPLKSMPQALNPCLRHSNQASKPQSPREKNLAA